MQLAMVGSHAPGTLLASVCTEAPVIPVVFGTTVKAAPRVIIPILQLNGIVPVSVAVNVIVVMPCGERYLLMPSVGITITCPHPTAPPPSIRHSTGTPAMTVNLLGV